MRVDMLCKPSYTAAFCELRYGEGMYVESGAMVAMSTGLKVTTGIGGGGLSRAIMRTTLGGESFFMARYQAEVDQSWVTVAPRFPGDLEVVEMAGQSWLVEAGSLLAGSDKLLIDVKYAGVRMALMKEGLMMLRVSGEGLMIVSSYGGFTSLDLEPDQEFIVDTGHLVAFTEGISVRLGIVGGLVTSQTSGEGLVATLRGPGRVLLQTRSEEGMRRWLTPTQWEDDRSK